MCVTQLVDRAQMLRKELCAENVFITGKDALVCLGILECNTVRSELYLEMPVICRRLIEGSCVAASGTRFKALLKYKDTVATYITSSLVDLKESGRFVYLGSGIWVETLESYLRDNDPSILQHVVDHLRTSTE